MDRRYCEYKLSKLLERYEIGGFEAEFERKSLAHWFRWCARTYRRDLAPMRNNLLERIAKHEKDGAFARAAVLQLYVEILDRHLAEGS